MYQIIELTDQEKYEMYNAFEKDVIIGMLIESNRHLQKLTPKIVFDDTCKFYMSSMDTSCSCIHCGKQKWEHK
jgi:predicted choloylglycine hydrolase